MALAMQVNREEHLASCTQLSIPLNRLNFPELLTWFLDATCKFKNSRKEPLSL